MKLDLKLQCEGQVYVIIRSCLHDGYILDKETITVRKTATQGQPNNAANKK